MDKQSLFVSNEHVRLAAFDPNPPDANGVRLMTEEQWRSLSGRYAVEIITPDALPPGALVQYRIGSGRDGVVAYQVLVPVESPPDAPKEGV